jgi:hypothetical protein
MSMLLCVVTPIAIYLAGDSRQYPNGVDTVQKVFLVGKNAMVAHGGIGIIGSWDAAREVGRIAAATPNVAFEEQLAFIKTEALKSLNLALERYAGNPSSLEHDPHLTIMVVKRDSTGRTYFVRQEFKVVSTTLSPSGWAYHAEAAPSQRLVDGASPKTSVWWDVPPECPVSQSSIHFDGDSSRVLISPAWLAAIIKSVAAQSPRCSQLIGGPIHAAISDAKGARWLVEK